ncbi:HTH_38 domain-containing protein [Trichonephila clavipes]|nr:HTH_38 domain-containing protein [Trichonephila clavipes]
MLPLPASNGSRKEPLEEREKEWSSLKGSIRNDGMNVRGKKALFWSLYWSWKQPAFDQVSEFDRGRIVAYRDCGLYFRKIGSRVGQNQTTVMRICDRWMQEGTTDRCGRSHTPQCTTSREDRQIVRMAVTDRSVTSRTVAQHIDSVMHHSVSALTIQYRLQQSGLSARRPLLGQPLTKTTDVSTANGAMKEGYGRQNGMNLSLLTSHASVCNTTMVGFESGDTRGEDAE